MNRDLATKDPQVLLERIKAEFPAITWTNYAFITHSWEYQVLILDDHTVFRFPTSSKLLPNLQREITLLQHVNIPSTISMPKYTFVASDYSFAGYPKVHGQELTRKLYEQLKKDQRQSVQESIALFLRSLHGTKLPANSPFVKPTSEELWAEDDALLTKLKPLLRQKLHKNELTAAEATLKAVTKLRQSSITPVLIHGDFYHKHVFWNASKENIGVIDFSDCNLGDPALDFAELFEYGTSFVRRLVQLYVAENEQQFMQRALLYYRRVGVFLMINSVEDTKIDFDYAYSIFAKAHKIKA